MGSKYIAQGIALGKSKRIQVLKKPRAMPWAKEDIALSFFFVILRRRVVLCQK